MKPCEACRLESPTISEEQSGEVIGGEDTAIEAAAGETRPVCGNVERKHDGKMLHEVSNELDDKL